MHQPSGDGGWRPPSEKLGGLCGLGTLQVGDSVQQRYPPASALFPSRRGKIPAGLKITLQSDIINMQLMLKDTQGRCCLHQLSVLVI